LLGDGKLLLDTSNYKHEYFPKDFEGHASEGGCESLVSPNTILQLLNGSHIRVDAISDQGHFGGMWG
jgi:hypothetical protein